MTEDQELQLEILRVAIRTPERVSRRRFDDMHEGGFVDVEALVCTHSDCGGGHYKVTPTKASHLILTLAAERDLLRLHLDLLEKRLAYEKADKHRVQRRGNLTAKEFLELEGATQEMNEAEAAYAKAVGKSKEQEHT